MHTSDVSTLGAQNANLSLPRTQWTPVFTNAFNGNGGIDLSTNVASSNDPQQFYVLEMQQ
jgi:hypothetical protein